MKVHVFTRNPMFGCRWSCAVLAGMALAILPARADWGSIRGNNRSHDEGRRGSDHRTPERRAEEHRGAEHRVQEHRPVVVVPPAHHVDRDLDVDRLHSHFWANFFPGILVHGLPHGYISVVVGGHPYYYYDGVYYQTDPTGYVVVTPPVGAYVTTLPSGAVAISVAGTTYFYAGGAYYVQQGSGFVVVPVPIGITVASLPPGATPVTIGGVVYYLAGGTYYLPVMQGGVTVYMTVRP